MRELTGARLDFILQLFNEDFSFYADLAEMICFTFR